MKRSPIRPVSKKQAKINRTQSQIKDDMLGEQYDTVGFNFCQTCGRTLPAYLLEASHIIAKSRGGETIPENIVLEGTALGCGCHPRFEKRIEDRPHDSIAYQKYLAQMGKNEL